MFAEDEARLLIAEAATPASLASMVDRRVAGLPLEHVLGWAEFGGRRISVDPGVFVPRRRTEFLLAQAVALGRESLAAEPVMVDLCCGSGALGAVLATELKPAELHAADVDPAAVRCARRNLTPLGGQVHEGDLFAPLPAALRGRIGVLTANVPYVPTGEVSLLPAEARTYEARIALDGGGDGLDVLRRVAAEAAGWLAPGGHVFVETSERQAPRAVEAFAEGGLAPRVVSSDEWHATAVVATRLKP